jgi:hypothetical protein
MITLMSHTLRHLVHLISLASTANVWANPSGAHAGAATGKGLPRLAALTWNLRQS